MSAVACGYQEREVQSLLESNGGVADTAVPDAGRFVPRTLRSAVGLPCKPVRVTA
jgi:hypothetical protein